MTILIKGVQILSGGQRLADKSDVFVSGDKISAIGNFPAKIADRVIDGQGCYVSSGFIDVNTDSDHYLSIFSNRLQEDFLRQGVTTIIGGQCGSSLAPLLYGHLDSIRKWTDIGKFNVSWHELGEFLSLLEKQPLGVNFGTLVGHSTVRRDLISEEVRVLTKNELAVFSQLLQQAISQGGFGMSTGLGYAHGAVTPEEELRSLASIVRKNEAVYATHLRNNDQSDLLNSVVETIALTKKTGVKTLISHFVPLKGEEGAYRASLEKITEVDDNLRLYFDLSPFSVSVLPLYTFLPAWARRGNLEKMRLDLHDAWSGRRIRKDMAPFDPDKLLISRAEGNDVLVGRSLRDCMELYEIANPIEALFKLMVVTNLRASVFYENINTDLITETLSHPRCLVASNAASLSKTAAVMLKPERARRTFPKFLSLVEGKRLMPIEEAVQKITQKPAELFGIQKRGEIREGYFADLTGFQNGEIKFTIVNGSILFENHELTNRYPGKILKHQSS